MGRVLGKRTRHAVGIGLVAGIVVIYLVMVGLANAFAQRPAITGIGVESGPGLLTLGRVMIGGAFLSLIHI